MIPASVKTYSRKANQTTSSESNLSFKSSNDESEKENKGRKTRQAKGKAIRKIKQKEPIEDSFDGDDTGSTSQAQDVFEKLLSSPPKQEVIYKPLSFWEAKLKQLEDQKPDKKKCLLYELSDSDESYTDTRKKKVKKKPAPRKKKAAFSYQLAFSKACKKKINDESATTKPVKPNEGAIIKERVALAKEKEKLKDREDKFTFDKGSSLMGITSTPAKRTNGINLVGTSKFSFFSPIANAAETTPKPPDFDVSSIRPDVTENEISTPVVAKGKRRKTKMVSDDDGTLVNEETEGFVGFESKDLVKPSFFFSSDLNIELESDSPSFKSACSNCGSDSEEGGLIKSDDLNAKGDLLMRLRFAKNCKFVKFYQVKRFYWERLKCISSENIFGDAEAEDDIYYYSDSEGIERYNRVRICCRDEKKEEKLEEEPLDDIDFSRNVTIRRRYKNFSRVDETPHEDSKLDSSESSKLYATAIDDLTLKESSQYPKIVVESNLTLGNSTGADSSSATLTSPEADKTVKIVGTPEKIESFPGPSDLLESTSINLRVGKDVRASDWNITRISELPPMLESKRLEESDPNPLESTRVDEPDRNRSEMTPNLESTRMEEPPQNVQINLIPGKKWFRSLSVIRQIQNKTFIDDSDGSSLKGRNYKSFVKEIVDMQPAVFHESVIKNSDFSRTIGDLTLQFSNLSLSRKSRKVIPVNESSVGRPTLFRTVLNLVDEEEEPEQEEGKEEGAAAAAANYDENDFAEPDATVIEDVTIKEVSVALTARDVVLTRCGQTEPVLFDEYFNERTLKDCKKIGEGVYGEVFVYNSDTVIKIIPIEGDLIVNADKQKKFDEVLSEIVIAMELSNLRYGKLNRTTGFNELKRCWCVVGEYPQYLIELWEEYDRTGTGSENDHPGMFPSDQLYIVLELAHGGKDLEAFVFNSAEQCCSVFLQTALTLAVAEKELQFEHRDLHWGNLLIKNTSEKTASFIVDGAEFKVPTNGVQVSIIDFTLSRMTFEDCCIFNDLSIDPTLFTSQGDYQFEIYRFMQKEVTNDWSFFKPKTNIFWLHYILDKMILMVRYKRTNTKIHKNNIKTLNGYKDVVLNYSSSTDFVLENLS